MNRYISTICWFVCIYSVIYVAFDIFLYKNTFAIGIMIASLLSGIVVEKLTKHIKTIKNAS